MDSFETRFGLLLASATASVVAQSPVPSRIGTSGEGVATRGTVTDTPASGSIAAVGVDVGGSSVKIGVVSGTGTILERCRIVTPTTGEPTAVVEALARGVECVMRRTAHLKHAGIGLGLPGHIDPVRRFAMHCNVAALDSFPIADALEERLSLPVFIDNDATSAALGEYLFGGHGVERLMLMTLGTGIGVGVIIEGRPLVTSGGSLGDVGHIIVDPGAQHRCRMGCRGCLEAEGTVGALERRLRLFERKHPNSTLARRLQASDDPVWAAIEAVRAGNPDAISILEEMSSWIGVGVASLVHLFDPDAVLIGGGLSAAGRRFVSRVAGVVKRHTMSGRHRAVRVARATLENDAGLIGAAALALRSRQDATSLEWGQGPSMRL